MRCFKGCFGSKETKKLLQSQHQQPLLPCKEEEEEEIIEPVKEIAASRSEIMSKEKISSPSERKPTSACVDDDENLMGNEKPEIKNKNREENDKKDDDDNDGGSTLHSIGNDINASSKKYPENLSQERISGDQKTTSTDSTESLFSLSIDSRKQFWTITEEQQGDNKEVNSPLKDITSRVESYDGNHLHFARQRVEVRIDGKKKKPSIRHEDDKENVKSNENHIKPTMKGKNSIDLRKLKPLSGTKENVIDTASFSSWLGTGGGSSENASLKRSRSNNNANNSPDSEKNYDVKGSMEVERKEFKAESNEFLSVQSTPSCSIGDDGDERYSDGTIGRYLQTKKRFKTSIAHVQM